MSLSVILLLPAVASQTLTKISVAVEQADGYQWQLKIATEHQMIARQHPQSAGIQRQRIMQTILCTKIGHGTFGSNLARTLARRPVLDGFHVAIERFSQPADAIDVNRIGRHLREAIL